MRTPKAKTFRNILFNGTAKGAAMLCQLLTASVLARNLAPTDVAVVSFSYIVIGFLGRFGDLAIGNAAVRRPALDQTAVRTAFTLEACLAALAFALAMVAAPFAHHFFEHPATAQVIRLLSLNFLVGVIGFIPTVILTRELNYRALTIPGLAGALVRCVVAVSLILSGWSFWSVVFADLSANLITSVVTQVVRREPLAFAFDAGMAREYLRFGLPLLGSGIFAFLVFNLDNLLVGTSIGVEALGYYALAFNWGSFICGALANTVNNVLFPTYAAMQHDSGAMRRYYLKTIEIVGFIAVIANTMLVSNAKAFLVVFLGKGTDKWLPAEKSLIILCVYGVIRAVTEPIGNCLLARGQTGVLLKATVVTAVIEILLLALVVHTGKIELVAVAVLTAYVVQLFIFIPTLNREFAISIGDIAGKVWPLVPTLCIGYLLTHWIQFEPATTFNHLAVRVAVTALIAITTHGILTKFRCINELWALTAQLFGRPGAPAR